MSHQLRLAPNTGSELVIDSDSILSADFSKTHTGLGDYSVDVTYNPDLEDRIFEDIFLDDGSTLLFRGRVDSVSSNEDQATTTLSGRGVAVELTDSEQVKTYSNIFAHEAIEDYWNNETNFTPTVTTPTAQTTVSNTPQDSDTDTEFDDNLSLDDKDPVFTTSPGLALAQTAFGFEAETGGNVDTDTVSDSSYSDGEAEQLASLTSELSFNFSLDYTIPEDQVGVAIRYELASGVDQDGQPGLSFVIDGSDVESIAENALNAPLQWQGADGFYSGGDLTSGSHTVRIETDTAESPGINIDYVVAYDARFFPGSLDNSVDANGFLSDPPLYPRSFTFNFAEEETPWNISDGQLDVTMGQMGETPNKLQLRLSQQTWFPNDGTEEDTTSVSTDFDTEVGSNIQGRVDLSTRNDTRTTATPTENFDGQELDTWQLSYDGNDIGIIDSEELEGTDLQNLQRLHRLAGMRFSVDHQTSSKPVDSFRVGDATKSLPDIVRINETKTIDGRDYANTVTVASRKVNGSRFRRTLTNDSEVNEFGTKLFRTIDSSLDTQADVDSAARALLSEKVRELDRKGEIEIAPTDVRPGFTYSDPFNESGGAVPLEEVSYQVSAGDISGNLQFDFRVLQLAENVAAIKRETENTKRGF
jgi:hypothetical protein